MIKKTPVAFPFYDKLRMQNRFKDNSKISKLYGLICPYDAVIPFQFVMTEERVIKKILLCSNTSEFDLTVNKNLIEVSSTDVGFIYTYKGQQLKMIPYKGTEQPLKMQVDCYYWLKIEFTDGHNVYSELIQARNFSINSVCPYLKIEASHEQDIKPLQYSKGFKQVLFLDTFIYTAEPEIEEESEENGAGEIIPTFQRMNSNYKITDFVPNFLKLFLTSLQMHNEVIFFEKNDTDIIQSSRVTCAGQIEDNGSYSKIELTIVTELLSLNACNSKIY